MVDLDDRINDVTHFDPAFADFPLPAQKVVADLSYQEIAGRAGGGFKTAVLATARPTARGVHAPPHP